MNAIAWDFKGLADLLLSRARELVPEWLPGGHLIGREYACGSIRGGDGNSMKVNLDNGKWCDFSSDNDRGLDLISLYARIEGLKMGDAAQQLATRLRFSLIPAPDQPPKPKPPEPIEPEPTIRKPPADAMPPLMIHPRLGQPACKWRYADKDGSTLFYIARYEPKDDRKQFIPWSWDAAASKWVRQSWPSPRPLYGLDRLYEHPSKAVLVVEGEKACDAARGLALPYVVITWPGGAKAVSKTDLTPLHGRKLLLWPDADQPGVEAMAEIAAALECKCPEIKLIDTNGQAEGWDAADAVDSGWNWDEFVKWAKPRARLLERTDPQISQIEVPPQVDQPPEIQPQVIPPQKPVEPPAEAVDVEVEEPEKDDSQVSLHAAWEKLGIVISHSGAPVCNLDNAARVLEGWPDFEDIAWFDVFHQRILTRWNSDAVREWSDIHNLKLVKFMQRKLGLRRMGDDMVNKAVMEYAHSRQRNEPRDWMEGLVWDGTPRVDGFLANYFGAEDNTYAAGASRNFWIGMVARVYRPGCKLDNMIILEGPQGRFKSTALSIIGGPWYAEAHGTNVTSKDFFLILHGKILVEIGEMAAFSKSEVATIKQVVSCATDRYRTPYGRHAEDHSRMNIFVGSTNEKEYLSDHTGARRFWPITCGIIDRDRIAEDRSQLFAEAAARFKKGEPWYEMPTEATAAEQETRRRIDEWEPIIAAFVHEKQEISVAEIAAHLKIETNHLGMVEARRIANCLRLLNWERRTARKGFGTYKMWYPPQTTLLPTEELESIDGEPF